MQLGMIGLGRMGSNIVKRLLRAGHECVVFDSNQGAVKELAAAGANGAATIEEFVKRLNPPRVAWLMVPAGAVDSLIGKLTGLFQRGDILVDGGNSYYIDNIR